MVGGDGARQQLCCAPVMDWLSAGAQRTWGDCARAYSPRGCTCWVKVLVVYGYAWGSEIDVGKADMLW